MTGESPNSANGGLHFNDSPLAAILTDFWKYLEADIPAVFLAVGEEDLQKENLAKASGRSGPTPES